MYKKIRHHVFLQRFAEGAREGDLEVESGKSNRYCLGDASRASNSSRADKRRLLMFIEAYLALRMIATGALKSPRRDMNKDTERYERSI